MNKQEEIAIRNKLKEIANKQENATAVDTGALRSVLQGPIKREYKIKGHEFVYGGGSASAMFEYFSGQDCYMFYRNYSDRKIAMNELGFDNFRVVFKPKGNAMVISDVIPNED